MIFCESDCIVLPIKPIRKVCCEKENYSDMLDTSFVSNIKILR